MLSSSAILPPSYPAMPIVIRPRRLASSKARSRFSELPLVDRPSAMSPARAEGRDLPGEHDVHADVVRQRGQHGRVAGQADGGQRSRATARIEEQRGDLLRVSGAAAVAEGQQPSAGREPLGGLACAGGELIAAARADLGAQRDDLVRLWRPWTPWPARARLRCRWRPGRGTGRATRSIRSRTVGSGRPAVSPGHAVMARPPRSPPWRAPGWCRRRPRSRSATLTSSSPASVATIARSSSSSRTTVTATAVSAQVMQTSPWHSGTF